jgi:arylmalonate decarboxylase
VLSLESVGVAGYVGEASRVTAEDICDASIAAFEQAADAEGVLIVCGGLRTLDLTARIEARCGVPVVSSMPAALWAAARLVGHARHVGPGYGRLLDRAEAAAAS